MMESSKNQVFSFVFTFWKKVQGFLILHTLHKFVYKHLIDILIDDFGRILQLEIDIFQAHLILSI